MAEKKLDRWKSLITDWQTSGHTREVFCRERDLKISTFSYWRTKINKLESRESEHVCSKINIPENAKKIPQYRVGNSVTAG